ncbi:hypothetical protein NBH15_18695 [Parabacteroides sp. W1-Q-101]|uniref:hypothetical protein n=1 Tax=Parabacteroides TaxID=375288 RepID=UPI0013145B76|nr:MULTISPECIES: hypothetical protein [Parabacteroides]MCM0720298.1 hypothetical protein [Parabacteroides sp. W1-Q-101]
MKDLEMYIDGQFIENRSGKWINVLNPSTEEVISRMPDRKCFCRCADDGSRFS